VHYLRDLRRLTPTSARRDHASASYGRSKLTVIAISTLKYLATPEEGRGRGGSLRLRTTNFHPCSIQWYQTGPDRTKTLWKSFAKQIGTDFVTLEFLKKRGNRYW